MFFTVSQQETLEGPVIKQMRCRHCAAGHCHAKATVRYRAIDLFLLPLFITGTTVAMSCSCRHQTPATSEELATYKKQLVPWQFWVKKHLGLALGAALLAWAVSSWNHQRQQELSWLTEPKVDDFYFVDLLAFKPDTHPRYKFTTLKLVEITDSELLFQVGNSFHSKPVSPRVHLQYDKAMLRNFFTREILAIPKSVVAEQVNEGAIYAVRRPQNLSIDGWLVTTPKQLPVELMPN